MQIISCRIFQLATFFLIIVSPVFSQRNIVRVDGSVQEEKNKLEGVSITVYQDKQFFAKTVTEGSGKFRFQLNYDADYMLEFSKPGYVTKKFSVNTNSVSPEDQDFGHEYGGWNVSLFKAEDGMDVSMFEKPFAKIFYNQDTRKFEHDVEYTELVKKEFEQLKKDFEKNKKEEAKRKKEGEKSAAATAAAEKAKIEAEVKRKSEEELAVKKEEERKKKEEAKLAQAVVDEEQRKRDKEQKAKIEEEKSLKENEQKKKEEEYKQLISEGENLLARKEFESAKTVFEKAHNLKPKETYPQQKIQEINFIVNSSAISTNKARRDTGTYKTKEEFLQALAKLYPQGITEEIYMEGNAKITRRIVVDGNSGNEYKFTEHLWGGRFWFKNGTPVNESVWNSETTLKK